MDLISFPSSSRLWIYGGNKLIADEYILDINDEIADFTKSWSSHGIPIKATGALMHNSILILMADESTQSASGCSIDTSVQFIRDIGNRYDVDFFNRMIFHYLKDNQPRIIEARDLPEAVQKGEISESTIFFDNLVDTKKKFQEEWIKSLKDSWHKRFV